jgi:predicted aspartyl protease
MTTLLLATAFLQSPAQITRPLEAPFRATEEAIIVDVNVNGKNISCMFDTGFSGHFVLNDAIDVGKYTGTMNLRDFVGVFQAHTVDVKTIKLGQLSQTTVRGEAVMQPIAHMTQSYGTHTDGIMGFSVIKDYVSEINFQNKKFIFHPSSTDITKRKPDNKRTFLVKMEPRGARSIELETEVNGKPVHLALDTGNAFYATTHKEVLVRVGLWDANKKPEYMTQAFVASGPVDSFYMFIPKATIFGVPVDESVWSIIDLPSATATDDGTVGYGFLKNFNIVIDYQRRYVWLENWTGKVAELPKSEPGMVIYQIDGAYTVVAVYKGSPAEKAGLQRGDRVLAIDGKSLSTVRPEDIAGLVKGESDSICKVVVSRGGIIHRLDVPRKLMVNRPNVG